MSGIPTECRAENARQLVGCALGTAVPEDIYEGIYNFRDRCWRADGVLQELTGGRPPVGLTLEHEIIQRQIRTPASVRLVQAELLRHERGYYIPMANSSISFVADMKTAVERTLQVLQDLGDETMLSILQVGEWGRAEDWRYLPATEYIFVALKWLYVAKMRRFLIGIPK